MTGEAATDEGKACPRCAETVKAAARVCRYCQFEFEAPALEGSGGSAAPPTDRQAAPAGDRSMVVLVAIAVVLVLVVGGYLWISNGSKTLTDAERVWCASGHDGEVTAAGRKLGVDELTIFLAFKYERDGSGVNEHMQGEFNRACKAAFAAR